MMDILNQIVSDINTMLPQFSDFINQFNSLASQPGITVVTDSLGNMSLDVPQSMSDSDANILSKRIGIIDRLISERGQQLSDLFQRGLSIENSLKSQDTNYTSQLTDKYMEFKRLSSLIQH